MKNLILFILLLLIAFNSLTQNESRLDSLKKILNTSKDHDKIQIYRKIAEYYVDEGEYELAVVENLKAIELLNNEKDSVTLAKIFVNIGNSYRRQDKLDSALFFQLKALHIRELLDEKNELANSYKATGDVYSRLENYKNALEYFKKAENVYVEVKDSGNLASVRSDIGLMLYELSKYKESVVMLEQSLALYKLINDQEGIAFVYNNLALSYQAMKQFDEALNLYKKSLEIKEKLGKKKPVAITLFNIGNTLFELYRYKEALEYLNKSLIIGTEVKSKQIQRANYDIISKCYEKMNDFKNALLVNRKFVEVSDSIINEENTKSIAEMQTKYETEKKEMENSKLQKENEIKELKIEQQENERKLLIFLFSIIAVVVILFSVFIIYRNKQKQKSELAKEQNRQQKLQFQAVIEAEEKERKRIAQELHDGLGQLLSTAKMNVASLDDAISASDEDDKAVFNNSLGLIDEAVSEVRNISHNLMPGALIKLGLIPAIKELAKKINTAGQINLEFICSDDFKKINESSEIAVYRIIQEVLNNTMRHSGAKNVELKMIQNDNKITLNISDDGKGMNVSKISESNGIGWKNIYSRVAMLNGNLEIKSEIGKGAKIFIALNINLKE